MPYKDPEKRRAYQREYMRKWYLDNKATHIAYVRNRDRKIEEWLKQYKLTLSCKSCGESHPACLEFHHINPKEKKFTIGRQERRISLRSLQEEIAKCRVLCANCHRKEHWLKRQRKRSDDKVRSGNDS
jgi:DNA-directed RNA polymerase subunit M/transcription elongation factor TFIIS